MVDDLYVDDIKKLIEYYYNELEKNQIMEEITIESVLNRTSPAGCFLTYEPRQMKRLRHLSLVTAELQNDGRYTNYDIDGYTAHFIGAISGDMKIYRSYIETQRR